MSELDQIWRSLPRPPRKFRRLFDSDREADAVLAWAAEQGLLTKGQADMVYARDIDVQLNEETNANPFIALPVPSDEPR